MAILQSCCFWQGVRKGSYASAIYTLVYFGFSFIILLLYIYEEQEYLAGERDQPVGESILERGDVTPTTVIFNILFMTCSLLMVISSIMVIIGIYRDIRELLVPWIIFMLADLMIELAHLIYLALTEHVIFEPVVGFLFTIDFFIMCLNLYCLLCVISQYQDYRHGLDCARTQFRTPQIVLHVSPTDVKSRITTTNSKPNEHKQLISSPFLSTNQNTNISTIPEEGDNQKSKPTDEHDFNSYSWNSNTNESIKLTTSSNANNLEIPTLTLDCDSSV